MWPHTGVTAGVHHGLSCPCSVYSILCPSHHCGDSRSLKPKSWKEKFQLCFSTKSYLDSFPFFRENKSHLEEDLLLNQADEVKLQIKCGRCQITAQSFAEIKFHLLYVHGEEIQGRLQEEIIPGNKGAQEELVKQAAPYWKHRPERRKPAAHCPSDEDVRAFPKLKKQLCVHRQNDVGVLMKSEGGQPVPREPGEEPRGPGCPSPRPGLLQSQRGFHCVLCAQTLGRKEELLLHWEQQHSCQDPPKLWTILNALSSQGEVELSPKTEK